MTTKKRRGPGRPRGSKNKPKSQSSATAPTIPVARPKRQKRTKRTPVQLAAARAAEARRSEVMRRRIVHEMEIALDDAKLDWEQARYDRQEAVRQLRRTRIQQMRQYIRGGSSR